MRFFLKISMMTVVSIGLSSLPASADANRSPIIKVEIGDTDGGSSRDEIRQLKRRIRTLEEAVIQLQDEVYDLKSSKREVIRETVVLKNKGYACTVSDPFGVSALGKGSTEVEARHKVAENCKEKDISSFHCTKEKIKCDAEG